MFDVAEIRNLDGEKLNIHLDINRSNINKLGEAFAHIRISHEPYLLVATKVAESGDENGREFSLLRGAPDCLPNSFFEQENIGWVVQMITPFIGEKKLAEIVVILEKKDD